MHVPSSSLIPKAGLLVCAAASLCTLRAADASKATPDKDAFPDFENYVTVSGQGNWVKNDKAAFEAEQAQTKNGFGGIESFQYSKDLKNDFALSSDGHALLGDNDYLAHLNISKNEFASFDIGYKRFRTYYDNAGGFFLPTSNAWANLTPFPTELSVDRGKFWAEVNIHAPHAPVVTLRYTNETRSGRKDTTEWGASDYTGLTGLSNGANYATRFIAPGYLELGEHHEKLEGLVKHTVGETTLELSVTGDRVNNLDTRYFDRYPGEVKNPVIAAAPSTAVTPANIWRMNNEIYGFDQLGNKANTFSTAFKVETNLSSTAKLFAGVTYSLLNSDFTEYRPLFTMTPYPAAKPVGVVDAYSANALNLTGGARVKTLTANVGGEFKIGPDLSVESALKGEDYYVRAADTYTTLGAPTISATGVVTAAAPSYLAGGSRTKEKSLTPEISVRYTGIKKVSLYGTAEYKHLTGDERVITQYNIVTAQPVTLDNDVSENHGRYSVGANWVPNDFVTLRGETFYKDHHNDFQNIPGNTTSMFVLGYQMKGAKFTVVLKPSPTVTFTTRYIYQTGTMQTSTETFAEYQSMDSKSHNLGETVDWTPMKQLYFQASGNLVYDVTSTAYPRAGVSVASGGNDAIHNANNNYWNGSVLAGFVVDKATNAELQYTYYKADNYEPGLILDGMPYGAGQTDSSITLALKRKITNSLVIEGKLGHLSSKNKTSGGNTDFKANVAYVSLQQAF